MVTNDITIINSMKRYIISALVLCAAMAAGAQNLFVGTYNIRNHNSGDDRAGNVWTKRCQVITDQINFEDPDVFGTQEVLAGQLHDMLQRLDGYGYIGVGRDDGKEAGEYAAIFYKKERMQLLRDGHFWLNQTPDQPRLGWDAACIRICTWGEFRQKQSGKRVFYFNLHMDHVGTVARREAAKLAVKKIKEIAKGAPVVLTGDFNVDQNDEIYRIFTTSGVLKDSYECARLRFAENGTFNDFRPDYTTHSRIDHVFVSPSTQVDRYAVLTNIYWTADSTAATGLNSTQAPGEVAFATATPRTPSDHYPVLVKLRLTNGGKAQARRAR